MNPMMSTTGTAFRPDAGTIDANWQVYPGRFCIIVDGERHDHVFAIDFVNRRVLESYPDAVNSGPIAWAHAEAFPEDYWPGGIPADAVECQELVCRWRKPDALEVWLAIDDWYEVDLCSATMRKREG